MAMTAPVTQRPKGSDGSDTFILSFVMPSGYGLDSLSVPLDSRVLLREEPAKLMAVRILETSFQLARKGESND